MKIRKVASPTKIRPETKELLDKLEEKTFGDSAPQSEKEGSFWWIVFDDDDKPVGYAGLTVYNEYNGEKLAYFCRVGLLKSARGQGLQPKLITLRETQARKEGCTKIITYTSKDNLASANNLIKKGYQLYVPQYVWGLTDGLYFYKDLEAYE